MEEEAKPSQCSVCSEGKTLSSISKDVKELKDAMLGTHYLPGGLVQKILLLEAKVKRIERKIIFYSGAAVGAGYFLAKLISKM